MIHEFPTVQEFPVQDLIPQLRALGKCEHRANHNQNPVREKIKAQKRRTHLLACSHISSFNRDAARTMGFCSLA
jgi:hypothetical protein